MPASTDPMQHVSSTRRPGDFDEFWAGTLAALDAVPPNVEMVRNEMRSDESVDLFDVRYDSYGGLRIAGWYARPSGRTSGLPGLLFVPGYVSEPKVPKDWARLGYATFSAAPRGKLRSNSVFNPGYPGLLMHNVTDRDSYAYRGFYMDAVRAFDILASLPEVDDCRIGVTGSSQGGALTLLVSALRPGRVRAAAAGAPYLCSFMDAASLTHSYPYEEINEYLRLHPDREGTIRSVFDYYDIHNFAPRIRAPIIVNIGLRDDVCPPETGFAVFDQIGSADKRLYPYDRCAHDAGSNAGHDRIVKDFLSERLNPVAAPDGGGGKRPARPGVQPEEFDDFWRDTAARWEDEAFGAESSMERLPLRDTEGSLTCAVRINSAGGVAFGYFSVPRGDGPFPALLEAPGYGSVVHISPYERRQKYAVLTLVHRGQRLADEEFAAAYPGLLTDGIGRPETYRYRGIVADVLAGIRWLSRRPEVAGAPFAVAGSEVGLTAASMAGQTVDAVLLNGPLLLRAAAGRDRWPRDYPLEELNDFVRANPGMAGGAVRTLEFFDPLRFAPPFPGESLVACPPGDRDVAAALVEALGARSELYVNSGRGHDVHEHTERWLSERLTG